MGLSNSFISLGRVAGPLYAGAMFDIHPNYPYLSGALILCVVFISIYNPCDWAWSSPSRDQFAPVQLVIGGGRVGIGLV